jgi:hypothetical protein
MTVRPSQTHAEPVDTAMSSSEHQRFAVDAGECNVQIAGQTAIEIAVHAYAIHLLQVRPQTISQCRDARALRVHALKQDARRLAHADYLMRGERTGTSAVLCADPGAPSTRKAEAAFARPTAPDTLRAAHLCADNDIRSTFICARSTAILPALCAAST